MQKLYDYEFNIADMHELGFEENYEFKMLLNKYHNDFMKVRLASDRSILITILQD